MKKRGFTLAEVLITLVIIGIIAAMTIPTLMNKTNEQETIVAVKKAYSVLSQAYQRLVADYGEINPSYLGTTREESRKTFGKMLVPYLSVQKDCGVETGGDCFAENTGGMVKYFNGNVCYNYKTNPNGDYIVLLSDGSSLTIDANYNYYESGTNEQLKQVFGGISVDVNGAKGPNVFGKDIFTFHLTKYGVIPVGTPYDEQISLNVCRSDGRSCTAWVVTKGNMDYLRKEVSW